MGTREHRVTREEAATGISVSTDAQHRVIVPKLYEVRLELGDLGEPCKYELELRGKTMQGDVSDRTSLVIMLGTRPEGEAELRIWPVRFPSFEVAGTYGITWNLEFEEHPAVDSVEGVQSRLSNLGYCPGRVDGDRGPMTKSAMKSFAQDTKLDDLESITERLKQEYGF